MIPHEIDHYIDGRRHGFFNLGGNNQTSHWRQDHARLLFTGVDDSRKVPVGEANGEEKGLEPVVLQFMQMFDYSDELLTSLTKDVDDR